MEIITNQHLRNTLKWIRALLIIGLIFFFFFLTGMLGLYTYGKLSGPPPLQVPQTSVFYGADQSIIGESNSGENRFWVSYQDISPALVDATIAVEDRKFFDHNGFDYKRIVGALLTDIKAMAKVQGASTITQQYARNLFLGHNKTWTRKIKEALYTVRLEMNYSKEDILEGYLNTIYYGHGAYGAEAAANFYFNKSAKDLTLSEASLLAGIPKAPSYYSPKKDFDKAKARQKVVLQSMATSGFITKEQVKEAQAATLTLVTKGQAEERTIAPYFLDEVKKELLDQVKLDPQMIEMGGLRIYTTLDPSLQKITEEQVQTVIDPDSDIQTAVVSMDPYTGEVKALVGGRNYKVSPFNRVTQAERQPGSTFKPFLYYNALLNGFTPSTQMRSSPATFTYDEGRAVYKPSNFNNYYANDYITLAQAIALSDNIFAVKTNMFLGPEQLKKTAQTLGITSKLKAVPSLALGTSSVKMIDMVKAYSEIANGGSSVDPVFITKVEDYRGNVIYERKREQKQILDEQAAFVTTHLMTGMFDNKLNDYTSVTGRTVIDQLTRPYAGKSGSTNTDSWMIGFTPQLATGVWTGYDRDKRITLLAEKRYAKEIWTGVMEQGHKGLPIKGFSPPDGVVGVYVNPDNGLLASNTCPTKRLEYFIKGTEPTSYCTEHQAQPDKQAQSKEKPVKQDKKWYDKLFDWLR